MTPWYFIKIYFALKNEGLVKIGLFWCSSYLCFEWHEWFESRVNSRHYCIAIKTAKFKSRDLIGLWLRHIIVIRPLKEITFECETINKYFFDNITKLAPNVEELELKFLFKLTNVNLKTLSNLVYLTRICLVSYEKKGHSVDDIGVIQLLDNCLKLKEVILELELNITSVSIDKLKEFANRIINSERQKEIIRFECFISSPELQSNRLKSLPKNRIINTKILINL